MISILLNRLYRMFGELGWFPFVALSLCHAFVTWIGFKVTAEDHLTDPTNFLYFYATTAATIGYGDLSPQGPAGRVFAALWLFPGSLIFFTVFITKITATASRTWKKRMNGLADLSNLKGAIVLVGYHPLRTARMIEELRAGDFSRAPIILVSERAVPLDHDLVHLVRTEHLSNRADLRRAGVLTAKTVIVHGDTDDQTLSASLAVAALNPSVRIVAHFTDEERAELLRAHTNAVCIVSQIAEIMVREVQDPGAAAVLGDLASASSSVAVFTLPCPTGSPQFALVDAHLRGLGATVIGLRDENTGAITYTPAQDVPTGGRTLIYIALYRLPADALSPLFAKHAA